MATRQYIGARYVPKFYQNSVDGSAQWESNVVYEPLIYVTLTNGHMYISKKQVPATVGSPASNIEYWLDIGSYNGFIDSLQDQINIINENLLDIKSLADDRYFLFVGDSYDTFVTGRSWIDEVATYLGLNYSKVSQGGYGFNGQGRAWADLITARTFTNADKYTDVVIVGGINDYGLTTSALNDAIAGFKTAVLNKLPNVKRFHLGYAGFIASNDESFKSNVRTCAKQYEEYCMTHNDFIWIENMKYIFTNTQLLDHDSVVGGTFHPVADGITALRNFVIEYLKTGHADYIAEYTLPTAVSGDFDGTTPVTLRVSINNATTKIHFETDLSLGKPTTAWNAFTNKTVFTRTSGDVNMPVYSSKWKNVPLFAGSSGTSLESYPALIKLNTNTPVVLTYKAISTTDTCTMLVNDIVYDYSEL